MTDGRYARALAGQRGYVTPRLGGWAKCPIVQEL